MKQHRTRGYQVGDQLEVNVPQRLSIVARLHTTSFLFHCVRYPTQSVFTSSLIRAVVHPSSTIFFALTTKRWLVPPNQPLLQFRIAIPSCWMSTKLREQWKVDCASVCDERLEDLLVSHLRAPTELLFSPSFFQREACKVTRASYMERCGVVKGRKDVAKMMRRRKSVSSLRNQVSENFEAS